MGESLEEVVATLVKKLDLWSGINEAQTSQVIILRLLMALGWDIWDPEEVKAEDTSSKTYRPDFLLNVKGEPAFVLEVKALDKTPTDDDRTQVVNYANSQNIRWALLTTGKVWEFFDNKEEAKAHEKRVLLFQLDDPSSWKFLERTLHRSFWQNPKSASEKLGEIARKMQKDIEEDKKLSQIKLKLEELVKEGNSYQRNENGLKAAIKNELFDDEKELALKNFQRLLREVLGIEPPQPTKEKILETFRNFLFKDYPEYSKTRATRNFKVEFNENVLQGESDENWRVIDRITNWRNLYLSIINCFYAIDDLYAKPEERMGKKIIDQVGGVVIRTKAEVEPTKIKEHRQIPSSQEELFLYTTLSPVEIKKRLKRLLQEFKKLLQLEKPILRVSHKTDSPPDVY